MAFFLQAIGAGFALFMLYICFTHYKRREFVLTDLIVWGGLWLVLLFLVLFPAQYEALFGALKIHGALQFIIISSIGVLYVISFFSYLRSRRNEMKLQRLITKIAVRGVEETNETSVGKKEGFESVESFSDAKSSDGFEGKENHEKIKSE